MSVQEWTTAPPAGIKAVLLFYADWHESTPHMTTVLQALVMAANTDDLQFAKVAAESAPALAKKYKVTAVPTFVLINADGTVLETLQGGGPSVVPHLTQAVQKLAAAKGTAATTTPNDDDEKQQQQQLLTTRLDTLIRSAPVMLFIKGSPDAPRCGFSRQAVELLRAADIPFGSFDILEDDAVRQGLKTHTDWPTYPQLYVHGEFMGGLDIMKEMAAESSAGLKQSLGLTDNDDNDGIVHTTTPPKSLHDRLEELIHQSRVMVFMKGLPSAPRCGFSRKMVEVLEQAGVPYGSFDILTDEEVRQGLKTYSDWPTYPQLYVKGELVGGLDIVQEMQADGSLKDALMS